jgi:hypothetical protein
VEVTEHYKQTCDVPQAGPRGAPSSQANGPCISLAAVLAASEHDAAPATEARVAAVEAREGLPLVLLLRDGSVDAPLGLYVHSRWLPLCAGPRPLVTGAALLLDSLLHMLKTEARVLLACLALPSCLRYEGSG